MDVANNGMNEVLVHSPLLEEYLREKYPNFKYISSTTKCILENPEIIEETDKYYLTVLDYRKNNDFDFLSSLKHPEKIELLVNAYCQPFCTQRTAHYDEISKYQLENRIYDSSFVCPNSARNFYECLESPLGINVVDLY
jgi:hypothetical protein